MIPIAALPAAPPTRSGGQTTGAGTALAIRLSPRPSSMAIDDLDAIALERAGCLPAWRLRPGRFPRPAHARAHTNKPSSVVTMSAPGDRRSALSNASGDACTRRAPSHLASNRVVDSTIKGGLR